jgi:hypothetical protein
MWKVGLGIFLFTWTLTTHGKYSASGDEPHYLMMTHSAVVDGDLDLANNYADNDGRHFGHDNLERGLHALPARTGSMRSIHDPGLAIVLVPVYAVVRQVAALPSESLLERFRMSRGLFTYSLMSLFLAALTAASLTLLAHGLSVGAGARTAALVTLALGVSPPVVSHAFLVFPEVLALAVTCLAVWFALRPPGAHDWPLLLGLAFLLGALPWTHHKYLVYGPGLLFVVGWKRWATLRGLSRSRWIAAILLFLLPQAALHLWTYYEWGTLGGALTTDTVPFSMPTLKAGAAGLIVDRESGILAYAPLLWIVPACLWLTRRSTWPFLVPAVLLYLPAAAYTTGWWAGFSPAARYIVPLVPLVAVAAALGMRHEAVRMAALFLVVPQILIDAVVWQWPRRLWPTGQGNAALHSLGPLGRGYEAILPPVQTGGLTPAALAILAAPAVFSAVLVALSSRTKQRSAHAS